MQKEQKKLLMNEMKRYKELSLEEKETYVQETYALQKEVENIFRDFFGSEQEIADEYIEQLREQSATYNMGIDDIHAVPCSRKIVYESAKSITKVLHDKNPKDIAQTYKKQKISNNKKKDSASKDSEFLQYLRGYSKYWSNIIDENEGDIDIEEGDLSWLDLKTVFS